MIDMSETLHQKLLKNLASGKPCDVVRKNGDTVHYVKLLEISDSLSAATMSSARGQTKDGIIELTDIIDIR